MFSPNSTLKTFSERGNGLKPTYFLNKSEMEQLMPLLSLMRSPNVRLICVAVSKQHFPQWLQMNGILIRLMCKFIKVIDSDNGGVNDVLHVTQLH